MCERQLQLGDLVGFDLVFDEFQCVGRVVELCENKFRVECESESEWVYRNESWDFV